MSRYLLVCAALVSTAGHAQLSIILDPSAQVLTSTCQSYALAYAIGTAPGTPTPISTAADLRVLESDLRKAIEAQAAKSGLKPEDHAVWRQVVPSYTGGKFTLVEETVKTLDDVYSRVGALTGNTSVSGIPALFSAAIVKTPVLLSFSAIETSNYASGHVVTVFGVGNPVATGGRELLVLNSAVKDKTAAAAKLKQCPIDDIPPGDKNYVAVAKVVSTYVLKNSNGYSVMYLK